MTFFHLLLALTAAAEVSAHIAAWAKGMYCLNGTVPGVNNENTNDAVSPMFNVTRLDYWLQKENKCGDFPPAEGDFLEIPVGKSITMELAENRAFTTLSYGGKMVNVFGDGKAHCDDPLTYSVTNLCGESISESKGISSPNLHAKDYSTAAGTVMAISYQSDLKDVNVNNTIVISSAPNTPFIRLANYPIPRNLPPCPTGGCHCVWGWIPAGFGQANMYLHPYRCKVTGSTSSVPLGIPQAPIYCADDPSKCVKGPKQVMVWQQFVDNNIQVPNGKSPGYNPSCGFAPGAQTDLVTANLAINPIVSKSSGEESSGVLNASLISSSAVNINPTLSPSLTSASSGVPTLASSSSAVSIVIPIPVTTINTSISIPIALPTLIVQPKCKSKSRRRSSPRRE